MRTPPIFATGHGLRLTALAATMAVFMAPSQARAQALNFCADTALAGLDPALHATAPALKLGARQIFDRLVENAGDGASVVPSLAVSWEVSGDGRQYTFKLRQGVGFHSVDGFKPTRELAPRDVVFSFQRQISKTDPFSPSQIYGAKNTAVKAGSLIGLIETVEPVGDDTVRFTLKQPDSGFLTMLAMESASILSAEYGAKLAKAGSPWLLDRVPVGTGPFRVAPTKTAKSKKKRRRARKAAPYTGAPISELNLVANGAYWRGAPSLGGLRIITTPNPVARFVGIKTGACQIAQRPAPADLAALRALPGVSVVEAGSTSVLYLAINTANKPFNDPWVRKALAKAIDRKALAKATVQSAKPTISLTGDAGDLPVADTGAARAMLKGADALGVSINLLVPSITPGNPGAIPAAISDAWTQAGAKVTLVPVSWSQLPAKLASADYDAALVGWQADTPDSALTYRQLLSCAGIGAANYSRWCNGQFETLLADARAATDPAKRNEALNSADALVASRLPVIALLRPQTVYATGQGVENLKRTDLTAYDFRNISLTPETSQRIAALNKARRSQRKAQIARAKADEARARALADPHEKKKKPAKTTAQTTAAPAPVATAQPVKKRKRRGNSVFRNKPKKN